MRMEVPWKKIIKIVTIKYKTLQLRDMNNETDKTAVL